MCWVALDRAIALAPQLGAADQAGGWAAARDEIRAAILEHGWSEIAGAYTQAFGSEDLDASSLMLAITGFLPGDDLRMKATIDATAARLTDERGLVYRYLSHDGLRAEEVDVGSGEMIGNFPQAFSHIGLVNAAWAVTQARQRAARPAPLAAAADQVPSG